MGTRLLLTAAIAASLVGLANPANASCYPQKPQTCQPCRIVAIYFDENGLPRVESECH